MNLIDIRIEDLLPHRDRMLLIDEIIEIDDEMAVTKSIVTKEWPLFEDNSVNPIILIELIAQTAGVYIGWNEIKKNGDTCGKGWIVGIKKAAFCLDKISLNSHIIVSSKKTFIFDNFHEILGIAKIDSDTIGEIILQVFFYGNSLDL
jgi:predicted hotdog family 3-hydroxylacyl-ACP dehydratase